MTRLRKTGMLMLWAVLVGGAGCAPSRNHELPYPNGRPVQDYNPDGSVKSLPKAADPGMSAARGQIPDTPPTPPAVPQTPPATTTHTAASIVPSAPNLPAPDLTTFRVRICAWVNGRPLFEGDLLHYAEQDLVIISRLVEPERSVKRTEILKKYLNRLIEDEVVYQDAMKKLEKATATLDKLKDGARKHFTKYVWAQRKKYQLDEEQYKKFLEMHGTTLENLYRQIEHGFIVNEYLRSRAMGPTDVVGPQEVTEYWKTHQNEFQAPDRVEWEDVFLQVGTAKVPTMEYGRELAKWVAGQLAAGVPIEQLFKYDDGDSSTRKGRGNGERHGDIRPAELEKYLFDLKDGQVGPPLELPTGIHVYRLVKREYAHQVPLTAEVQTKIRNKLRQDIYERERDRVVRQLKGHAVIEVDPNLFK